MGATWLLINSKKLSLKTSFQPIILIIIGIISIRLDNFIVLKTFPLILSTLFFLAFTYAQISKEFFLIKYISKFKKLDEKDKLYLQKTHIIWIVVTGINVSLHSYFLLYGTLNEWTFYSTIGWYILLGCGIIFQILFRRFYEQKKAN
ncbi:MAG: hypothetical protein KAU90_07595 [Sulfurovaceae bacterium]|nr:hypothetical protein [Sulfurovaceae bacterium]